LAVANAPSRDKKGSASDTPRYATQDILFLTQLIETGTYRPVIDRCYPFEQVIDATRYVETQQKTGNDVLTIGDSHTRGERPQLT
jgi:NADPH:quinone reductase-like Zn-dependent oxidoreductase